MDKAILKYQGKEYSLEVHKASIGPNVIDVSNLYKDAGIFTYDPGFMSTASCKSKITYINGREGILKYRGYPVDNLAKNKNFLEVAHLLLYGNIPNHKESKKFKNSITHHSLIHEQLKLLFRGFRRSSHPMAIMVGAVGTMSSFYNDCLDMTNKDHIEIAAHRLIAKIPTLAAMSYKYTIGQPFIFPDNSLNYTENFLHMMFTVPSEDYKLDKVMVNALDKIFILHADHEQNASTSTVRLAGSSGANPFACIAAGIASLWGPLHGGANEAVIKMLEEIDDVKNIDKFIEKAKDKNDPFRLMGFGHRVYKHYDPRAEVLRETCHEILDHFGKKEDKLFKIAIELEKIALNDEYFIEKKLYPNVDFYSGIIYRAMNIPSSMYTVLFAVARTIGWVSQWKEMIEDPSLRIGRPRQLYIGNPDSKIE